MFLDASNYWISLVFKPAVLRVSRIAGNDNVSVNDIGSRELYYSKMSKASAANSAPFVPVSVCLGTERLGGETDERNRCLFLDTVPPFPPRRGNKSVYDFVYGLCYQPTDHIDIPNTYVFPGMGRILDFLRPLFPTSGR